MLEIRRQSVYVIIITAIALALLSCSSQTIKENEVGIVVGIGGGVKIYQPGEEAAIMPFFQKFYTVSTNPVILSFIGGEGVMVDIGDGKTVTIESQITYFISDIEKAIDRYGYENVHRRIRERVKDLVSELIREGFSRPGSLNDTRHRIQTMAETNIKLNEMMNPDGISISSYNIRHE